MNTNTVTANEVTLSQLTRHIQSYDQETAPWLDVINVENEHHLSNQYADLCQQHHLENKWILMINPENQPLEELAATAKINAKRILKVHTNKTKITLSSIGSALCKGHCSAVILCNPALENEELSQLTRCAQQGKTACIVLNSSTKLH